MQINKKANQIYYQSQQSLPCDCQPCQNYCHKIQDQYPKLCQLLAEWVIDVRCPFEIDWIEDQATGKTLYLNSQYLSFGECLADFSREIEDLHITKASSHPTASVEGSHFIINIEGIDFK